MKKNRLELGRTLIEMLGVLAIMGALSLTGLSFYNKSVLNVKVQQAWEAVFKFKSMAQHYELRHPEDYCNQNSKPQDKRSETSAWYCMAEKSRCGSYCPFEAFEFLPPFAKGSFANFYIRINKSFTTIQILNIKVDHLCSTMFPDGHEDPSNSKIWVDDTKKDGKTTYKCYRYTTSIKW